MRRKLVTIGLKNRRPPYSTPELGILQLSPAGLFSIFSKLRKANCAAKQLTVASEVFAAPNAFPLRRTKTGCAFALPP